MYLQAADGRTGRVQMVRIGRMAFSTERVCPGLPMDCLSLLFHQLQSCRHKCTQETKKPLYKCQVVTALCGVCPVVCKTRELRTGVGLFNRERPNRLTEQNSTEHSSNRLAEFTSVGVHNCPHNVFAARTLKSGAGVPDF